MMKYTSLLKTRTLFLFGLVLAFNFGCERDLTDEAELATFPNTAEIFTDNPVGLTDEFFVSFDPAVGANTEGFGTDDNEAYEGSSSIRIDVPAPNDPNGGFIGGIFLDRGAGRDLTEYNALTFWAKASTTGVLGSAGFGTDFIDNTFAVSGANLPLSTDWRKYIIPIPDPSKLTQERGMFLFAAGTDSTGGFGFVIWMDELRFENLGTIGQPRPQILFGEDVTETTFVGSSRALTGLQQVFNLPNGLDTTVIPAPAYYNFTSSNPSVATVDEFGQVSVIGVGTAVITAEIAGIAAQGSLTLESIGAFPHAPIPTQDAANVVSLFSDAYQNVPVRHYNGFFAPFQTTQGGAGSDPNNVDLQVPFENGDLDNIINYTMLNFVSIGMYETVPLVNISGTTHLHLDINVRDVVSGGDFIRLSLESGTGTGAIGQAEYVLDAAALNNVNEDGWTVLDIPLADFTGSIDTTSLGQLFFISDATVEDIWVDNVYFYSE